MNVLVVDADDEVWVGEQRRVFTQRLVGDKVSAEDIVADPCVLVVQTATRRQRNVRRCASSTVTTDTITPDSPQLLIHWVKKTQPVTSSNNFNKYQNKGPTYQ